MAKCNDGPVVFGIISSDVVWCDYLTNTACKGRNLITVLIKPKSNELIPRVYIADHLSLVTYLHSQHS